MSSQPIKLTRGVPPPESFPVARLGECAQQVLAEHSAVVLQYGPSRGFQPLRSLIAQEAGVAEARVILGQGSLQLQDFCARLLLGASTVTWVEEPSYDRAVTIFRRTGSQIVGFPLGDDGPDMDMIEDRLRSGDKPGLFYVIPDFQNPSGTVLSLEKRHCLARLAREYGFYIVEDVPYRRLRYRGEELPTLHSLAPEWVMLMSSYSKLISPGLRVGYVIAPDDVAARLARVAEDTYINPSYFTQAIVYQFIQNGWLTDNIATLKTLYQPRLDAMLGALDQHLAGQATWRKPDGGFFVGMTLDKDVRADDLLAAGRQAGLELTDGRGFFANGGGDRFVRLPFCALTPDEISLGVARLAEVVERI